MNLKTVVGEVRRWVRIRVEMTECPRHDARSTAVTFEARQLDRVILERTSLRLSQTSSLNSPESTARVNGQEKSE